MNNLNGLKKKIKSAYEQGVTLAEAEKLAAEFLYTQVKLAEELAVIDLDARMKKSGLKAISAAIYLDAVGKSDKKPSDTLLENLVIKDSLVQGARNSLDNAEVKRDELQNFFNICKEAHIYFRGVAKGRFE